MQFSTATIAAAAAFLPALVSGHVSMVFPASVFQQVATNLNPLDPSGSNYPCFVTSGSVGEPPLYEPGSQQTIGLQGSAVHGGGSCQISITYDNPPTRNSVFKVIKSIHGRCPGGSDTGNLPADPTNTLPGLSYNLPSHLPSGNAVLAWTWFNKIGNREMYMRCAPIKIGGSNTDRSQYNGLPEIFKANIGNGCSTIEGTNVEFPNPGAVVESNAATGKPVGDCGTTVVTPPEEETPEEETPEEETPEEEYPEEETPIEETPIEVPVESKPPVFVGGPSTTAPTPTPTYAPVPTTTKAPVQTSVPEKPTETPESESCSHGAIICNGTGAWSRCVYGKPVSMGKVAPGTFCRDGRLVARSIRFSHEHARRRHSSVF